jgi:anti-anti-sigma factor
MAGLPYSAPSEFQMKVEQTGQAAVVKLAGSIHMDACEQLEAELIRLVDLPTRPIILDLSQLNFICSLGLGALVAAYLRSRREQGAVRVAAPSPSIRALLEVTKLVKLFPPYESVELAMSET